MGAGTAVLPEAPPDASEDWPGRAGGHGLRTNRKSACSFSAAQLCSQESAWSQRTRVRNGLHPPLCPLLTSSCEQALSHWGEASQMPMLPKMLFT